MTGEASGPFRVADRAAQHPGAHEITWVEGPDTVDFLDGLLSQHIATMAPGTVARSLLLAPQGKLRATMWVLRGEGRVGLVSDAGRGDVVAGDLTRFRLRVDAEIHRESAPCVDVIGRDAGTALARLGLAVPEPGHWSDGPTVIAALGYRGTDLPRYLVAGPGAAGLDLPTMTSSEADAVRIAAGEPVMGVDIDEKTIPQEAGVVEGAVDFEKGCYLGQELVARIDSRGRVNRHLRILDVPPGPVPPGGAEAVRDDEVLGAATSVAGGPEGAVALALLRREAAPGDEVELRWPDGSTTATVRELPTP